MSETVTGKCPSCQVQLKIPFNSALVDLFGQLDVNEQKCPNCKALLSIDIEVQKTYSMTLSEKPLTNLQR